MYYVVLEVFPGSNTRGSGVAQVGNRTLAKNMATQWASQGTDYQAWWWDGSTWNEA